MTRDPHPSTLMRRFCLCCSRSFEARSKYNRLCEPCKTKNRSYYGPLVDYEIGCKKTRDGQRKRQRSLMSWEEEAC